MIHRPILGIEAATNPQALTFGGDSETDDSLRRRASRALEASGRATPGAITGALVSVEGIREQDVRIEEDHLAFPGLVKVSVASDLTPAESARAAELIELSRPAGVRVVHNLVVAAGAEPAADLRGARRGSRARAAGAGGGGHLVPARRQGGRHAERGDAHRRPEERAHGGGRGGDPRVRGEPRRRLDGRLQPPGRGDHRRRRGLRRLARRLPGRRRSRAAGAA